MDNPVTESSELDTHQAGTLFANILEPQAEPDKQEAKEPAKPAEPAKVEEAKPEEAEKVEDAPAEEGEKVTIEVDGKTIELSKAELADYYKNGLRQADYTKKTMEAAEQRKAADADISKAREERQKYAVGLQQAQTLLQAQLQEQSQIDWQQLLSTDPVEYLKQQHLANTRQAQLQRIGQEQQQLHARQQAEHVEQMKAFIRTQQDELLAKLPEWKDESKAKADREAIKSYLKGEGLQDSEVENITDHRVVVISRKAMLYDQMMSKAQAAAKKVENLPQRVERSGNGESQALDKRSSAYQKFARSGKVEDLGSVFASIL